MRLFAIRDRVNFPRDDLGYLFYYPKKKQFFLELSEHMKAEYFPILLDSFRERGELSIGSEWSLAWVMNRIIPYERQNLDSILEKNDLPDYDEFSLLLLYSGRCEQDDIQFYPIRESHLPQEIMQRLQRKVKEVIPLPHSRDIIAVFRDEKVRRIDLSLFLAADPRLEDVMEEESVFQNVSVETGGNGITWGRGKWISAEKLYSTGVLLPITGEELDFLGFYRLADTADACAILGCSRQYMDQLVKRGKLKTHRTTSGRMLFRKHEIDSLQD